MFPKKFSDITGKHYAFFALVLFAGALLSELLSIPFIVFSYVVIVFSFLVIIVAVVAIIKNNLSVRLTFVVGFVIIFSLLFILLSFEHINPPIDYSCEGNGGFCVKNSLSCESYGVLKEKIFVQDPTYLCMEKDFNCCLDVS